MIFEYFRRLPQLNAFTQIEARMLKIHLHSKPVKSMCSRRTKKVFTPVASQFPNFHGSLTVAC